MVAISRTTTARRESGLPLNGILAADIGSVHTRAVLIDMVEGQYRLVGRAQALTTAAPPVGDVAVGLRRALERMTNQSGRIFMDSGNEILVNARPGMGGTEVFFATASGGRPMKVVMIGLTPDISVAAGHRALASTYVDLVDVLSINEYRTPEEQLNALLKYAPDLIFIVGGTDYGGHGPLDEVLQTVRLAMLLAQNKPAVLYAGNEALKPKVRDLLSEAGTVYVADNVRPSLDMDNLQPVQLELGVIYGNYRSATYGGFHELQELSALGVFPTAQASANVIRYLGMNAPEGVICVDVGSSSVTVTANINQQTYLTIQPDMGIGHSAISCVESIGTAAVARWLSFKATDDDIMDYAWNKTLRPSTVPHTPQDLEFEYAIAREAIRSSVATARTGWRGFPNAQPGLLPAIRTIIGAGAILAQPINPGIAALLLLDSLQPVGIVDLKLDPYGLLPALGSIGYAEPLAVVQVLESGGLVNLGTAVCPEGRPSGSTAMTATVKFANGRTIEKEVPSGSLATVPIPPGQKAQVWIRLARGLSLGRRARNSFEVEGGGAGLVLDGRGRPILVPKDLDRRAAMLPKWYAAVQEQPSK